MQNSSKYSSILLIDAQQHEINHIKYFDDLGNHKTIDDSVERIVTEGEQEFVELKSGLKIHIDRIHSVDGDMSPNYSQDFFSCDCV